MSFWEDAVGWFSGNSLTSSLAKVALLGYTSRLLNDNVNESSIGKQEVVDPGVRLQLDPNTDNKIPVLYGSAYFGGYITDANLSADYKVMKYVLTLAEKTGTKLSGGSSSYTFHNVYFNNNRVIFQSDGITVDYTVDTSGNQDISMRGLVKVYMYANGPLQPSGFSGTTPNSYSVMPNWTSTTHPMTGLIYAIVEVTYNKSSNVTGLPDCVFHLTNSMTLPGDVLNDYMTNDRYGAGISSSDIDTSLVALNSFANTGFSYKLPNGTSTTSTIGINGLVDTQTIVLTNMEELAKAASSWMTYDIHQGKWSVIINKVDSSVASLTDDHIIGDIAISGTSLTQLNNISDVKYQNTDILDKTDFVKISIPEEDLFQNEPRSSLQITLPFTNKQAVAMKLGLQLLKQARVDKIISFKTDYSFINLRAGEVIDITNSVYGYTNKKFRIINAEESENDQGSLEVSFKALEYDATVYDYDIQEYEIETDDGILTIGSIGKPDIPVVTKVQESNTPKIVIDAVVPSGIVDAMEFWITFDVTVPSDVNRAYIQIGTFRNTNGTSLTENQAVTYNYSQLGQSDFFVKVRGVNSITSGPYSDPTGLIEYVPVVIADTVSDTPVSVGGQLMSLGLLTLLNNLDGIFKGLSSEGSLFDKIFQVFKNVTGVDLVGEASNGTLVVTSEIDVLDEGELITPTLRSMDFVGSGVIVTGTGDDVVVTINGSGLTTEESNYVKNLYSSGNNATAVCDTGGFLAAGRISVPSPTVTPSCSDTSKWTVAPTTSSVLGTFELLSSKKLLIKSDTSTSGSYTLSITCSSGLVKCSLSSSTLNSVQTDFYMPTSITGIKSGNIYSGSTYAGNSSTPLVIVGSYNCINQMLQNWITWDYNSSSIAIPPPTTSATVTYSLTVNGVTKTHTETYQYISYSTAHPFY